MLIITQNATNFLALTLWHTLRATTYVCVIQRGLREMMTQTLTCMP